MHEPHITRRLRSIIERANERRQREAQEVGLGVAPVPIPIVTMYQLRHTGATWMLREGVPESHLQAVMGHSSPAMTRRYAHVVEPLRRGAAALLDASLRSPRDALLSGKPGSRKELAGRSDA